MAEARRCFSGEQFGFGPVGGSLALVAPDQKRTDLRRSNGRWSRTDFLSHPIRSFINKGHGTRPLPIRDQRVTPAVIPERSPRDAFHLDGGRAGPS